MSEYSLIVQDLKGRYYSAVFGVVYAVDGVSFSVKKREILGLAGESGCGKSTLLRLLTGVAEPPLRYEGGNVIIIGNDGREYNIWQMSGEELRREVLGKLISYIPQSVFDALDPTQRIRDFMAMTLEERTGVKYSGEEIRKIVGEHFERLGLSIDVLDRYPHELSGGMRQRAVIAISTYLKPIVLLLDEPTSALDVSSQKRLIELLISFHKDRIIDTIIFASHDITLLRQLCQRIAIMYAGKIVEIANTEDIIYDPLHPYTRGLIESLLPLEETIKKKKIFGIPGAPPILTAPPAGCRFHSRCGQKMDICKIKEPPFIEQDGRFVSCWLYGEER
ncbi:MAG: ABC transporter ATP-binding protein [Candidatus Bathyarchaeia archaeon]